MVAFRSFKKRVYKKKTGNKKRVYPKKKPSFNFEKRVKSVISKMAENKVQNYRGSLNIVGYDNLNWTSSIIPITPYTGFISISQGTTQANRIGNCIHIKSLKLSGVLRPTPYNAITNANPVPIYVKLLFLTRKDTPNDLTTAFTDVLQYGNTSEGPGTSAELRNLQRMINTDDWMVHTTRTYKLGHSVYEGTSQDLAAQSHANNDFKINHFINIDLTKYCIKNFKFDDNTVIPSSRNIVMYPLVYTSNAVAFSATDVPAVFDYTIDCVFEDI